MRVAQILESFQRVFMSDSTMVYWLILAALVGVVVASMDRLLVRVPERYRLW
jgi:hypothetical protein